MPYEHRFGNCCGRNDCRHDPAHAGIFIHGGDCISGPFHHGNTVNRFSITIPCSNKLDQSIDLAREYGNVGRNFPTFNQALEFALECRRTNQVLATCPIYSCCEMLMDTTHSGRMGVQLLSWPDYMPQRDAEKNFGRQWRTRTGLAAVAA